jgi:hypothetical protein
MLDHTQFDYEQFMFSFIEKRNEKKLKFYELTIDQKIEMGIFEGMSYDEQEMIFSNIMNPNGADTIDELILNEPVKKENIIDRELDAIPVEMLDEEDD